MYEFWAVTLSSLFIAGLLVLPLLFVYGIGYAKGESDAKK